MSNPDDIERALIFGMTPLALTNARAVDEAEIARRQAAAPLKPVVDQQPCDVGLFSDVAQQLDLVEIARQK